MQDFHVDALVDAYILGALEPEEVDMVERHLATCTECQALADAARASAESFLYAAPPLHPPAALRDRLMQQIAAEARATKADLQQPAAPPSGRVFAPRVTPPPPGRLLQALHALRGTAPEDDPTGDVLRTLLGEPDVTVWPVAGTADAPAASARLVGTPRHHEAVLVTSGLAHPGAGKAYQVWLLTGGEPEPNALFAVGRGGHGATVVHLPHPLTTYDMVAVTPEPESGSPGPTGPIVLAGALER
jgi:anti-sigma-K factor RskA